MILLLILIGFIYLSWSRVLAAFWRGSEAEPVCIGDRILGASVLTVGQMCAVGYILGSFGWWNLGTAAWVNWGIASLVGFPPCFYPKTGSLADLTGFALRVKGALRSYVVTIMTILVLIEIGLIIWMSMSMPPMSYDFWGYHGPKAVLMNLTGHLPPYLWDGETYRRGFIYGNTGLTDFYPANGSILMAYVLLFTDSMRLTSLIQMPFVFMMALSVYRLIRRVVKGNVETAAICGLGVFGLWTVMGQMGFALTDIMSTGLLWAGYSLVMVPHYKDSILSAVVRRRKAEKLAASLFPKKKYLPYLSYYPFILSAVACGLAVGVKMGSMYWVLGVFGLAVYQAFTRRQ